MGRSVSFLQVEPRTFQVAQCSRRHIIQAIEPEAERLLVEAGGRVLREQEGYVYEEYWNFPWPTVIIFWPPGTQSVYLSPDGQEDSVTIFMAMLLPGPRAELHLIYDYRFFPLFCSFEEFLTLQVAQIRLLMNESGIPQGAERENERENLRHGRAEDLF
jgi:hypothetical protein